MCLPHCGVLDVVTRLSRHGVKREDEQKYAAQRPPKQSRCLLFSHKPITTELNKCSVRYGFELFFLARTDTRMGGTDGTTSVLRLSRNEWISLSFSERPRGISPSPYPRSRSAIRAKWASPCLALLPPTACSMCLFSREEHVGGGPRSRRYVAAGVPVTVLGKAFALPPKADIQPLVLVVAVRRRLVNENLGTAIVADENIVTERRIVRLELHCYPANRARSRWR